MTGRLTSSLVVSTALAFGGLQGVMALQDSNGNLTGAIAGVVMALGTNEPVRGARVVLTVSGGSPPRGTVTGDEGRFAFADLPNGDYELSASKVGYLNTEYGATKPGRRGTPVHVSAGQGQRGLTLRLPRGSVITGTIRTDTNAALPGADVIVFQWSRQAGRRRLSEVARTTGDDRGVYRAFGLPGGDYVVGVQPRPSIGDLREARPAVDVNALKGDPAVIQILERFLGSVAPDEPAMTYVPVYYPGTPLLANATALTVGTGEEADGIDVTVALVPAVRIQGRVTARGVPQPGARVMLGSQDGWPGIRQVTNARPDGTFEFLRVPPGQYRLTAAQNLGPSRGAEAPILYGSATVVVNGLTGASAEIEVESAGTVSGSLEWDTTTSPAPQAAASTEVQLESVSDDGVPVIGTGRAEVSPTGRFTFLGVAPGRYLVRVSAPSGRTVVSAIVKGLDALDQPFDLGPSETVGDVRVILSSKISELSGTVRRASGPPAPDCTVIVFAENRTFWTPASRRIQAVRPDTAGTYVVRGLPAGAYRVAVASDIEPDAWFDPAVLETLLPVSTLVGVQAGVQVRLDLRIGG